MYWKFREHPKNKTKKPVLDPRLKISRIKTNVYTCTGCPEVPYNFDTPLFSGMAWDLRLIFGVFKVQMKTFFYIYKTWGWIAIWLRKYLGKLEHVLKFSILTPSKIACQMRQNQCIKVLNDINLPKKKKIIVEFNLTTSFVGVLLVPNFK